MTATHPRSPLPTRLRAQLSTLLRACRRPGPLSAGLRAGLLATGAALLVLALALGMALQPLRSYAGGAPEVLRAVHTDALHTTYDGSVLRLSTRIGLGEYREADPANLIFNLEDKASARVELPDLPAFAFLGKPGDPVWIAPESQDPDLIWPGWDTETITPGTLAGDAVDLTLLSASGPGNVEIFFNYDDFTGTAQRLFSAADPTLRTLHQPVGRHVHANWSFTALGTYHLAFQATATTTTGTPIASTPTTYTFVIGPYTPPGTPSTPTTPPGTPPTTSTPSNTPTATPTGPGHPTPTGPEHPTPTAPGRTTPTGPTGPTGPTAPTPTSTRTTTPTPATTSARTATPTPAPTTPPSAPASTRPPSTPPTSTSTPTTPLSQPPRSSASSGGDEEHATSDSPPNLNNSNPPPGSLPPCPTTSTPPTNPTTQSNPTTAQTNPPGTTNSPSPTNPSTTGPTNPANPTRTTLDNGHADYAVRLENGHLNSRIKDGTKPGTPIWRDPSSVTIKLTPASATHAPGGAFNFLGPAGSPLWQIPQTQKDGVIWLGWNTEELTSSQLSTPVDWRLTKVTGPGTIAVFEFDSFGQPKIIFNSRDGLPDIYKIPLGTHAHGNWSFTKPGTYQATFTHSATLTTGTHSTATSTLTFVVPAVPSNASNGAHPAVAHTTSASGAATVGGTDGASTTSTAASAGGVAAADATHRVGGGNFAAGMSSPHTAFDAAEPGSQGSVQAASAVPVRAGGLVDPASPARANVLVGATSPDRAVLAAGSQLRASVLTEATSPDRAGLDAAGPAGSRTGVAGVSPSRGVVEGCRLASTGAEVGPAWIGGGVTLLVIGVVTLVATRRRRGDA
ncbi:choice-of-anchor M domain-containing protein [Kribbella ginsengisoli]|uniref:Surface-anchored protein n=1 Tax=Kribbella ginsengisoli TaxID=363865 RepID=A0ABP6WGI3_9ACTN